jgi:hypothetical protein
MRTMLAILMITSILLAQDEPEKTDKPGPDAKPAPAKQRREDIDRIVAELQKELGGEHDELLRRIIEKLEQHRKRDAEIVVVGSDGDGRFEVGGTLGLLIAPDGAETMTGTFEVEGRKGKYTLKSTGGGQYRLDAEITGDGDTTSTVKDEGTFAGLRAKYKWLRGGAMFAPRAGVWAFDAHGGKPRWERPQQPVVGVLVRPAADELRHHLEIPVGAALVVESVTPGSRADQLGLRKYDVLLRIDGELVETPEQVKKLAGKDVTLEYIRRAQKKRLVTE